MVTAKRFKTNLQTNAQRKNRRTFLFLQGHPSFFARDLATELEAIGHRTIRVNFCMGDALFGFGRNTISYRGRFKNWRRFLENLVSTENITDILYYGDRKPYHIVAAAVAHEQNIDAFTYEFGYLRPDWITIERSGMSAYSHFPTSAKTIRKIAAKCKEPDMGTIYPYTKTTEILHEVAYNLTTVFTPFLYPFYNADRYYNQILEYVRGIPGLFTEESRHRLTLKFFTQLRRNNSPYFLFPLQLQNDYQLRCNSPFKHQSDAIRLAISSFAAHAPKESLLIFKLHPYDNGWERWPRVTKKIAAQFGVHDRVKTVYGGNLDKQLKHACGCVLINSTVGMHALQNQCPVKVLGAAVYDIEGLCDQKILDQFWCSPKDPDDSLVKSLIKVMAGTIQIKGNFFNRKARAVAVQNMINILIENRVNGKGAYVDPPPRLEKLLEQSAQMGKTITLA